MLYFTFVFGQIAVAILSFVSREIAKAIMHVQLSFLGWIAKMNQQPAVPLPLLRIVSPNRGWPYNLNTKWPRGKTVMFFRKLLFLISLSSDRRQVSIASYTLRVRKNAIQGLPWAKRAPTCKYEQVAARREIQVHRTKRDKTDVIFEKSVSPSSNNLKKQKHDTSRLTTKMSQLRNWA